MFRRLAVLAALALAVLAPETGAKTINVAHNGTTTIPADSGSTTDVAMSVANAIAIPGDKIVVKNGTYSTLPRPTNDGTQAAYIMYVGEGFPSASTSRVGNSETMPQFPSFVANVGDQFITWKYLAFQGYMEWAPDADPPSHDSLAYCRVTPSPTQESTWSWYNAKDMVITGCYIVQDELYTEIDGGVVRIHRDTLTNNNISFINRYNNGGAVNGNDAMLMEGLTLCVFTDNDFYADRGGGRFPYFAVKCQNNTFARNTWRATSRTPNGTLDRAFVLRDSSRSNKFTKDRFLVVGGDFATGWEFSASGAASGTTAQNKWDSCTVVNPTGMGLWFQNGMRGDTLTYNSVSAKYGNAVLGWQSVGVADILIKHNTFYAEIPTCDPASVGPGIFTVHINDDSGTGEATPADTMTVISNVFVSGSVSTSLNGISIGMKQVADTSKLNCDYNLIYHNARIAQTGDLAVKYKLTVGVPTLNSKVGAGSVWCVGTNSDCNSVHADPLLENLSTDVALFDPDPTSASPAISAAWPDSFVGSRRSTLDGTPPSAISDLTIIQVSSNGVTVKWTEVGDDALTGIATYYDIRYSTSEITSENFTSATIVGGPAPGAPSGQTQKTITGLTANTTYWFAVKAVDENGNAGAISNVVTITTSPNSGGGTGRLPEE